MEEHLPIKVMEIPLACPVCGNTPMKLITNVHTIPYFRKVMETTLICEKCGYRHPDIIVLGERTPMRYEIEISSEEDLTIRVIRSSSGTIRIPELGVTIEPGPYSMGFVSNVEGVLERVLYALRIAKRGATKEEEIKKAEEIEKKIGLVKEGKFKITLVLEDPLGNSAIISSKAKKRELTEDEIKKLKYGMIILETKDMEPEEK